MNTPSLPFLRAVVLLVALAGFAEAQSPGFFSNTVVDNAPPAGFTTAPVLDDTAGSAANVSTVLGGAPAPLAVQVRMELGDAAALGVFNNFGVKFILTEFNTLGADRRTKAVADAALGSALSAGAFGNFNLYPNLATDPTRPASQASPFAGLDYAAARGHVGTTLGAQFAAPMLFPGTADFRNPAQGNSNSPNIRSALFVLPIQRLTLAELGLRGLAAPPADDTAYAIAASPNDPAQRLIPWVARFNNNGNAALGGGSGGTGFVQNAATPSNGQLLSRGDFQAQVLHFRLRGADDLAVLGSSPGVVGYSFTQEATDVNAGWTAIPVATGIFTRASYAFASLSNAIADSEDVNGPVLRDTEPAGSVWSGVYDRAGSTDGGGLRRMVVLISNLSAVSKTIDLPSIGGFGVYHDVVGGDPAPNRFVVPAGSHRLLSFNLAPDPNNVMAWVVTDDGFVGLDNNRNGVGVGDPFPAVSIDVTADSDVCTNSSTNTATVTNPGGTTTYHWAVEGGTILSGQGTNTITYGVTNAGSAVVALTAISTDAQQVQTTYEGASIVRIGPPSDLTVDPFVVANSVAFATAPGGNDLTYAWTLTGAGSLVSSRFAQSIQFRAGASGTIDLSVTVTSSTTGCSSTSSATVTIDQIPIVTNDRALATANHPVDIQVLANDSDPDAGDTLTLSLGTPPSFGMVTLINNGTAIRYTPNGPVMNDSFTYKVTDSHGATATGTVTIGDLFVAGIGDFRGLATPAAGTPSENARHGYARVTVGRNGAFTGFLYLAAVRRNFAGVFDADGVAHFTRSPTPTFTFVRRAGETPLALSLQLAPGADSDQVSGLLSENGVAFASLEIERVLTATAISPYTFTFARQGAPNRGVPSDKFPQGNGYSIGTLNTRGAASIHGRLADYGPVIKADVLTKGFRFAFYQPLYGGFGSISGWISYRNVPGQSDADNPNLDWFRPPIPKAALYKPGWPGGIGVNFVGSKYQDQGHASSLPGLGPVDLDGNAELQLYDAGVPVAGVFDAFNLSPANRLTKTGPNPRKFHGLLYTKGGGINAFFRAPGETKDFMVHGVLLQKINYVSGFFLGRTGSGLVVLVPADHPRQSP